MKKTPALSQLFGGYLNLDWPEEYADPWRAVEDFLSNEPEYAPLLSNEIISLLNEAANEAELRRTLLDDLDSGYLPDADGWTYRAWLREVARRAQERSM